MHIEFTSLFEAKRAEQSNSRPFPMAELLRHAALLEDADIDRLQVDAPAGIPSSNAGFVVLQNAAQIGVVLQHQAGEISPVTAAEQFGLFDQLSRGRLTLRILPPTAVGFAEKHDAHERVQESLDEYLTLMKRLWASEDPFDFEGPYFRLSEAHVASKPFGLRHIALQMSGLTGIAIKVAVKHADYFELAPAPIAELRQNIARVRQAALVYGRAERIRFSLAVRPVVAADSERAWVLSAGLGLVQSDHVPETRLVGTPEQVALQFINLVDLGVTDFVLHGLQDEDQLSLFARHIAPLVRNTAARQGVRGVRDLLSGAGAFGIYAAR